MQGFLVKLWPTLTQHLFCWEDDGEDDLFTWHPKRKHRLYVSPFFSCQRMTAHIRQGCLIAWVRKTKQLLFCLSLSVCTSYCWIQDRAVCQLQLQSPGFLYLVCVCLCNYVCICSFHAHFLLIDLFVSLCVYLSSVHYTIIAIISLWNKSCRRLLSSQPTYCTMRNVSDTYWLNCDGLLTQ